MIGVVQLTEHYPVEQNVSVRFPVKEIAWEHDSFKTSSLQTSSSSILLWNSKLKHSPFKVHSGYVLVRK